MALRNLLLIALIIAPQKLLAWGERGHHIVAHEAARLIKNNQNTEGNEKGLGPFFNDRAITMGHLSNIPDISWKDYNKKAIKDTNFSTHFLNPEVVLGLPGKDPKDYGKKITQLPLDYNNLIKKYNNSLNQLPALKAKKVFVYKELGMGPWHSQYLYNKIVEAFKCGASKTSKKKVYSSNIKSPLKNSLTPSYPTYKCMKSRKQEEDYHAAIIMSGILAHFVGDLAQPYHTSANYDGWYSGHGGIHVYFESLVLQELDEGLNQKVAQKLRNKSYVKKIWNKLKTPLNKEFGVTQLLLNLSSNSYQLISEVERLDKKLAITKMGTTLKWGDNKRNHPKGSVLAAQRKPPRTKSILKGFEPLIIERLAIGSLVLSKIWESAWTAGGKPNLSKFNAVSFPYPLDVPYIWPEYAKPAVKRILK